MMAKGDQDRCGALQQEGFPAGTRGLDGRNYRQRLPTGREVVCVLEERWWRMSQRN